MEGKLFGRRGAVGLVLPAMVLALFGGCFATLSPVLAGMPKVTFDVGQVVECRDVTPDDFARTNPTEKMIEAHFRVSVLVTQGRPEDIEEVMITLISPKRRLRVVDFAPRTRLATSVVGEVETVESEEVEKSLSASLGGRLSSDLGVGRLEISPNAGNGKVKRNLSKETFRHLPPKTSVLVSGTTYHEYGVFFKLRPFEQESIEGLKQFTCRWVVPASWRGDWAVVTCQARGHSRNLFYDSIKQCGLVEVPIGLYLQGDATAKRLAKRLAGMAARGKAAWNDTGPFEKGAHCGAERLWPSTASRHGASRSARLALKPVLPEMGLSPIPGQRPAEARPSGTARVPVERPRTSASPPHRSAAPSDHVAFRTPFDALSSLSGRGWQSAARQLSFERRTADGHR